MRWSGVFALVLVAALSPACREDSNESAPSAEQTEALCDVVTTMREESLADLGDGDPLDPNEYNASVDDFYLSLREYVPPSIQEDIGMVASSPGDDLRDAPDDVRDAALRVGSYFRKQCGDHLEPR